MTGRTRDIGAARLAVGVDAGGTTTRALAVDERGHVVGTAHTGGTNPNSHPPERAARALRDVVVAAISPSGTRDGEGAHAEVAACVVGMAGSSRLTDPAVRAVFDQTWAELGIEPRILSDAETAFASATTAPDGTVLVAGTGSIAGRIRARRMVATAGGYGWLLGDEGSGFWLGRQAVRHALDVLADRQRRGTATGTGDALPPLARAVLDEAGIDPAAPRPVHRLITAVNAEPPVRLARFAPLVSAACADGDPDAESVVEHAATLLAETATATRDAGERTPVVLVGSVLGESSAVGGRVRARLRAELPGAEVVGSTDGVLGAAWLAALEAFGPDVPPPVRVP